MLVHIAASKPHIYAHFLPSEFSRVGQRVSLSCSAAGSPPPSIRWTLDGTPLPSLSPTSEGRHVIGSYVTRDGDVISHVNVTAVRVQDGGAYRCVAENRIGVDAFEGRLNVYGELWDCVWKSCTSGGHPTRAKMGK